MAHPSRGRESLYEALFRDDAAEIECDSPYHYDPLAP
jgi:hypothetical protein